MAIGLSQVAGLGAALANRFTRSQVNPYGGGQFGQWQPVVNGPIWATNGLSTVGSQGTSGTYENGFKVLMDCQAIRLVYANAYTTTTDTNEYDGPNNLTLQVGVEYQNAFGNAIYPVTWNGSKTVVIASGGVAISDPVWINVRKSDNQPLYVRTYVSADGTNTWPLAIRTGVYGKDGYTSASNLATPGSGAVTVTAGAYSPGPQMVLGLTRTKNQPVIGSVGDSILYGSGNYAPYYQQGFLRWACDLASFGCVIDGHPGDTAAAFADTRGSYRRRRLLESCNYVICEYGTNDVNGGTGLATIQSNLLAIWESLAMAGFRVYQTTMLPECTSTDNFETVGNQSKRTNESNRVALNNWLRDTSAAGAAAQSNGNLLGAIDIAAPVEVNSSNVLTQNGGYWLANAPVLTSQQPTSVATFVITNTGWNLSVNGYAGYTCYIKSGTGSGQTQQIVSNTATSISFGSSWGTLPDTSSVFDVFNAMSTDGLHPTTNAHILIANAILPVIQGFTG